MEYIFIHADMVNGLSIADEGMSIEVDECDDIDDVRYYLKRMSEAETFERFLKVPADLVDDINQEYGVQL